MEVFIRKVVFVILICDFCKVLFDKNYLLGIPKINISVLVFHFRVNWCYLWSMKYIKKFFSLLLKLFLQISCEIFTCVLFIQRVSIKNEPS